MYHKPYCCTHLCHKSTFLCLYVILPTNTIGTAILRGPTPNARPPMPTIPGPIPFLKPPIVEKRFHQVTIRSKITTQQTNPKQKDETRTTCSQAQKASSSGKQSLTWFAQSVERRDILKIIIKILTIHWNLRNNKGHKKRRKIN